MHATPTRAARPAIDYRLYRFAFAAPLLVVIATMFSLGGAPGPLEPATPPGSFDGDRAATQARQIADLAPDRRTGSPGDEAAARLVAERFDGIVAGSVTEQAFEAELEGETVSLRNVLLTLPGDSAETLLIVADRSSPHATGAATSAAATGVLVELANALGLAGHERTFVLASTTGAAEGAVGVRALLDGLPERDAVAAIVVISQPGASGPRAPFVVTSSTGAQSGPIQLERTAELAVATQAKLESSEPSAFDQLARLAIPSGLGDQAPLIADGFDAVAISSAGERQLEQPAVDELSGGTVDAFGRAIQSTIAAIDTADVPADDPPDPHLELSDNLVPGWALSLLALSLILPAAAAAIDALARAMRRGGALGAGLAWAAARGLPFLGALLVLYGLVVLGAIPDPPFPFDPGLFGLETRAAVTLPLIVLAGLGSAALLRRRGITALAAPDTVIPAVGAVACLACLALWIVNPYLALLAAPAAHPWLLCGRPPGPLRATLSLSLSLLACLPVVLAIASVSAALELGAAAPWTFALMIADGQIEFVTMLAGCLLAGALLGGAALALRRETIPVAD